MADCASVPERVRDHTSFTDGHPGPDGEGPEPDEKLAAVRDRSCLYDAGMYVALRTYA
jgi:deferrochelatase/peroxidase EfeB